MRVPTVKIRNKRTGDVIKVNVEDYATDLGKSRYSGWELIQGESDDIGGLKPEKPIEKTTHKVRLARRRGRPRKDVSTGEDQ